MPYQLRRSGWLVFASKRKVAESFHMKRYFMPNLEIKGRIVRGLIAIILLVAAIVSFPFSVLIGMSLLVAGLFVLFEALRGWCALRACGIRTKI
jgi:hypothetical protein